MVSYAKRMSRVSGDAIKQILKYMADPAIISFGGGSPAKEAFPLETVEEIAHEVLHENGAALLQYGATEGFAPLRASYIEHIAKPKGLQLKENEVITLTGSQQGLDLAAKIFLDPGDVVLVEAPTFLGTLHTLNTYEAKLVPVEMDDEGVDLNDLEAKVKAHHPKIFYVIPTFQNPTGKTLGAARRKAIAELAAKYEFIVLEDDPYGELRYRGEVQPPIKNYDTVGNVILLNSFSKILSPGLRVGIAAAAPEIIQKMAVAKQGSDTHTSNIPQAIADSFLRKGLLRGHLEKILPIYRARLDAMLQGLDTFFPGSFRHTSPEGGLFVWGELSSSAIDMPQLLARAASECKVAFVPGQYFYIDPATMGQNTMRLNFSASSPEEIQVGLERLGGLLKQII